MSYLLRTFAHSFLIGDRREFELLRSWLEPFHQKAQEKREYKDMRRQLDFTWQQRNYRLVAEVWAAMERSGNSLITDLDRRRARYALNQINKRRSNQ
jgi:hypothetical protein